METIWSDKSIRNSMESVWSDKNIRTQWKVYGVIRVLKLNGKCME